MKYKMLVLDMDDTLLGDDLLISNDNVKALEEANKRGIIITMCSGRASKSIVSIMNGLDFVKENDYYISYNGAVINDLKGNNIFYEPVPKHIVHNLIDIGREFGVDVQLYDRKKVIVENVTSRTKAYERLNGTPISLVEDLKKYDESIKILFNYDDIAYLEKMQKYIQDLYKDEVNVFFTKPTFLEVLNNKADKGIALEYLSRYLHINREEIIAMGDSFNDKYMIEYAGMGVAMCNGRDEIKQIANYVTKCNNNEHGVAEIINKFMLK